MTFLLREYRDGKTVDCGKLESRNDAKKWVAKKYTRFCIVATSAVTSCLSLTFESNYVNQ